MDLEALDLKMEPMSTDLIVSQERTVPKMT